MRETKKRPDRAARPTAHQARRRGGDPRRDWRARHPDWRGRRAMAVQAKAAQSAMDPGKEQSIVESRATIEPEAELLDARALRKARRANPRYRRRLGFDPEIFGAGGDAGSEAFARAVARYQKQHGLTVDGIAGPITCEHAGAGGDERELENGEPRGAAALEPGAIDPGKERSIVDSRATLQPGDLAVQRRASGEAEAAADPHAAAARGVAGSGGALPHAEAIQASFGRHDVGGIRAHVGGEAAAAAEAIGAEAYATGSDVAFRRSPDLHTAAHEAAHVIQQKAGVSLKGGLGTPGDPYERHADAVADTVVRGESAEGLLDRMAGDATRSAAAAVQRKPQKGQKTPAESAASPAITRELQVALEAWNTILDLQVQGIEEFNNLAKPEAPKKPSTWWKQAVRFALATAFSSLTDSLAVSIAGKMAGLVGSKIVTGRVARDLVAEHNKAQLLISSKITKDVVKRLAAGTTDEVMSGMSPRKVADLLLIKFVADLKEQITVESLDKKVKAIRARHYDAIERTYPGAGVYLLRAYANHLVEVSHGPVKDRQMRAAESAWISAQAKMSLSGNIEGLHGTVDNDPRKGSDLTLPGGLGTDDTRGLSGREKWADGILILEMDWPSMAVRRGRIGGLSANLKAILSTQRLGDLDIPVIARGNVRGDQRSNQPGELRVSRNEKGRLDAVVIETGEENSLVRGDLLPDREVARFLRRILAGDSFGSSFKRPSSGASRDPLPISSAQQLAAAKVIFDRHLAGLRIGKLS